MPTRFSVSSDTRRILIRSANGFVCRSFKAISALHQGDRRAAFSFLVLAHKYAIPTADGAVGAKHPRKISVHALANSLVIPYETMRRSVNLLIKEGLCERDSRDSVVLCSSQESHAAVARLHATMSEQLVLMLRDLHAIGFDFRTTSGARRSAADADVQRLATLPVDLAHVGGMLFLRLIEVGGPLHQHDVLRSVVFAAIVSRNLAHIASDKVLAWQYGSLDNPPPDEMRKAVSVRVISEMLGLSVETTRRYVCQLIKAGECERVAGQGVIVPASVSARKDMLVIATRMALRIEQTLAELGRRQFDFATLP